MRHAGRPASSSRRVRAVPSGTRSTIAASRRRAPRGNRAPPRCRGGRGAPLPRTSARLRPAASAARRGRPRRDPAARRAGAARRRPARSRQPPRPRTPAPPRAEAARRGWSGPPTASPRHRRPSHGTCRPACPSGSRQTRAAGRGAGSGPPARGGASGPRMHQRASADHHGERSAAQLVGPSGDAPSGGKRHGAGSPAIAAPIARSSADGGFTPPSMCVAPARATRCSAVPAGAVGQ